MHEHSTFSAFAGDRLIGSGSLEDTVLATKAYLDHDGSSTVLVFDDRTGTQLDFDWRGTPAEVVGRLARHPYFVPAAEELPRRTGPGRPKLGVVSREVSLLPRHWEWLAEQPGGASAALRKLVEHARKSGADEQRGRRVREAVSRFMFAVAGNSPGFEEASRALFADDRRRFLDLISAWPQDVRTHLSDLWPSAESERSAEGSKGL